MGFATVWHDDHSNALREYLAAGKLSFSRVRDELNARFGTRYSRNAVIGRAGRMGLNNHDRKPTMPNPERMRKRKPRVRIIQANGNSNRHRIIESVESEPIALRCAAVEPLSISIDELRDGVCHYPYGDIPPYAYCGHATLGGPYCDLHHELCHTPAGAMRGRERPDATAIIHRALLPNVLSLAVAGDEEAA